MAAVLLPPTQVQDGGVSLACPPVPLEEDDVVPPCPPVPPEDDETPCPPVPVLVDEEDGAPPLPPLSPFVAPDEHAAKPTIARVIPIVCSEDAPMLAPWFVKTTPALDLEAGN